MDWLTPENWNALIALLGIIREMLSMVFLAVLVLGGAIVAMSGYLWYKVGKIAKGQLNKTNN